MRVLESDTKLTIQQNAKKSSPSFAMNLSVSQCVPLFNGIQFHVNGGYINLEFPDLSSLEEEGIEDSCELDFVYDYDKPTGYWLRIGEATLFFHGDKVKELLETIEEETKKQLEKEEREYERRKEADRFISKEVWASIDNMMEK